MGYSTRKDGHATIKTFEPDDTDEKIYIAGYREPTMQDIFDRAKEKWGENTKLEDLDISAEHIQTDCLGYDRYDSSDYTDYIVITYCPV